MSHVAEQIIEQQKRIISLLKDNDVFLRSLHHKVNRIMAQIDDLTAALAQATTDFNTFAADVTSKVADLQAQIAALQAANPGVDLSGVLASAQALDAAIVAATPAVAPAPTA